MYKVYFNDLLIHDLAAGFGLSDPVMELADNTVGSFTFTIYDDNPCYSRIRDNLLTGSIRIFWDNEMLFKGRVMSIEQGFERGYEVTAEGELGMLKDSIQRQRTLTGGTPEQVLTNIIRAHNSVSDKQFRVGTVTVTDFEEIRDYEIQYQNTLDTIMNQLVNVHGGHLYLRYDSNGRRILDYLKECPRRSGQNIEFGENLLDYTQNVSASDLATVVIPLGARIEGQEEGEPERRITIESANNGMDYLEIPEAVARYGIVEKTVEYELNSAELLKRAGMEWLTANQYEKLTLTLSAVDLADYGLAVDHLRFLDSVRCTSGPHGMDVELPLTSVTLNLTDPTQSKYVLGTPPETFTGTYFKQFDWIKDQFETMPTPDTLLDQAADRATRLLTQSGRGGHVVISPNAYAPEEILIMDTNDPETARRVWRWNLAGLGRSDTGIDGPYIQAFTSDGYLNTQFIEAGSVTAEHISADYTSSQDRKWHDELNNNYETKTQTQTKLTTLDGSIRSYVGEQITTTRDYADGVADQARADAESSTDTKLANYYNKSEINQTATSLNSSITSTYNNAKAYADSVGNAAKDYADGVGDDAKEYADDVGTAANSYADSVGTAANQYTDEMTTALNNSIATGYYSKTEIDQQRESINLSVQTAVTTANTYADGVGSATKDYADSVGNEAKEYADDVGTAANSYADSVRTAANAHADSAAAQAQANAIADTLTKLTGYYTKSEIDVQRTAIDLSVTEAISTANVYADGVGTAANTYADGVGTAANTYADGVGTAANTYADQVGNSAQSAANAYTDSKLINYYAKSDFTMTPSSIIASLTTANGNISAIQNDYVKSADIANFITADDIPSQDMSGYVTWSQVGITPGSTYSIVTTNGLGTLIQQTSSDVIVAWNAGSNEIKLTNGLILLKDGTTTRGKLHKNGLSVNQAGSFMRVSSSDHGGSILGIVMGSDTKALAFMKGSSTSGESGDAESKLEYPLVTYSKTIGLRPHAESFAKDKWHFTADVNMHRFAIKEAAGCQFDAPFTVTKVEESINTAVTRTNLFKIADTGITVSTSLTSGGAMTLNGKVTLNNSLVMGSVSGSTITGQLIKCAGLNNCFLDTNLNGGGKTIYNVTFKSSNYKTEANDTEYTGLTSTDTACWIITNWDDPTIDGRKHVCNPTYIKCRIVNGLICTYKTVS